MTKVIKKFEKKIEKELEEVGESIEEGVEEIEKEAKNIKKKISKKDSEKDVNKEDLEKSAEEESTEEDISKKKKELLKKAEKLKKKVEQAKTEELKEQVKEKKKSEMILPLEEYVKSGIYIGTKVVTPNMKPFVYRRRADGLAIFNTDIIDEKIKKGIEYLSKFNPEDVIVVCKRQAGWRIVEKFSEITGIRAFTKKYPAGILTNTTLPNFFEAELAIITDSWLDKNALNDMTKVHKKVLMICDTNNFAKGAEKVIIGNNKSSKSLGIIYYLLTKGYCNAKGIEAEIPELEWWTGED